MILCRVRSVIYSLCVEWSTKSTFNIMRRNMDDFLSSEKLLFACNWWKIDLKIESWPERTESQPMNGTLAFVEHFHKFAVKTEKCVNYRFRFGVGVYFSNRFLFHRAPIVSSAIIFRINNKSFAFIHREHGKIQ